MKPLAVTMGEPAGIGMELITKAWSVRNAQSLVPFFVICDPSQIGEHVQIEIIDDPAHALACFETALPVYPISLPVQSEAGKLNAENAPAVLESIEKAVSFAREGHAGGVVTNPIHKAVLKEAGFSHPGHTEFLGALCDTEADPVMMLAVTGLRVVPLSVHIPLSEVSTAITQDLICRKARITHQALQKDFGIESPRLAVAGLNPHAGEGGQFGAEEMNIISPAVAALQAEGLKVSGPHSADSLFHEDARQNYDAALCMYHDQALIPLKTIDFYGGVNITLGLPIIRTSPDHGTALNIAGQGIARPDSLIAAIKMAGQMAQSRGV